jgi:hypothetical protein
MYITSLDETRPEFLSLPGSDIRDRVISIVFTREALRDSV